MKFEKDADRCLASNYHAQIFLLKKPEREILLGSFLQCIALWPLGEKTGLYYLTVYPRSSRQALIARW